VALVGGSKKKVENNKQRKRDEENTKTHDYSVSAERVN
jgi:hypothetical protein